MAETETSGKSPGRGLRISLAVSVAINLAVVGLIAGAAFNHGSPPGRASVRDLGFGPFTEALSRDERNALRRAYLDKAPDLRATGKAIRRDMTDLLAALRADPFDADQLARVLDSQGARLAQQMAVGQQLMRDFFIAMPPEARRAFADRLEAGLRRDKKP